MTDLPGSHRFSWLTHRNHLAAVLLIAVLGGVDQLTAQVHQPASAGIQQQEPPSSRRPSDRWGRWSPRTRGFESDQESPLRTHQELEQAALHLERLIQQEHLPFGTVMGAIFASPESRELTGYTRAGDSAIWTGHYLAAEAFRYAATGSLEALENTRRALAGIQSLVDVTQADLLARALVPADAPLAASILNEEAGHGTYSGLVEGQEVFWIGNTSRDQYSGVFFGLMAAFELVDDLAIRSTATEIVTRLLNNLLENDWVVEMPDGEISTLFHHRPDQRLAFLQIGRHLNPDRFEAIYQAERRRYADTVVLPIAADALDVHNSYFKFNLNVINLFNLLRLEDNPYYRRHYELAYQVLRRAIRDHDNAHFNLIDRVLAGPDEARDSATRRQLDRWLDRPRRDYFQDLRAEFPSCGQADRACIVLPIEKRVPTDFLWQRSPFLLFGGGTGRIQEAGIDFLLPYWMARYYGVLME